MEGEQSELSGAFREFSAPLQAAVTARGFTEPTEPQRKAVPHIAAGADTLVVAPTGTGKTEAAMLPIFDAIDPADGISALYITPLRALNRDMRERFEWWGEQLGLDVAVRHGDTSDYQRRQQAVDPPDVLITTPETVQILFTGKRLRAALEDVEHVVVDEIHELAAAKRGAQLTVAFERLRNHAGPFQRVGLSATVGDPAAVGAFLTGGRSVEIVTVAAGDRLEVTVRYPQPTAADDRLGGELLTDPARASQIRVIQEIVEAHESTLIFVNTRQTAEALGSRFGQLDDVEIGVHHGSLAREARIEVEDAFKAGTLDGLLCTSSMELGIDVGHVDHVIQYASPRQVTRLLQRVGRAGHHTDEQSRGTIVATRPEDALEAAVIARRALAGAVEPAPIHEGSLDVVANQIAGLVEGTGGIRANRAYEVITAAYPFDELPEATFEAIIEELVDNRIITLNDQRRTIEPAGTWQYVYANISMIPDEETYAVEDLASGQQVGTLDERFVQTMLLPGETFIHGGEMWRVDDVDDDEATVTVTPIEDPAGEVPSWIGREIPVPEAVANEVGRLRETAASDLAASSAPAEAAAALTDRYPAAEDAITAAIEHVDRHRAVAPVPTPTKTVIEATGRTIRIHLPFGHAVTETVGRVLSALLGQQTGSAIGLETDPYRIDLEVPPAVSARTVKELLLETDSQHIEPLIELTLDRSDAVTIRLAQVAEHFGAVKSWRGGSPPNGERLRDLLADTPAYEEAKRALMHEDLAVESATEVFAGFQTAAHEITIVGETTPIGAAGQQSGGEFVTPENADASVIETVKDRIRSDRIKLLCLHCTDWERTTRIKRVQDQPTCPECESTRIAALNPWDEETPQAVTTTDKDDDESRRTERAYRSGSLVQSHGKQAVIALAGRGVGPDTAARILNNHREREADFYRDILEAERKYARTKSFWD